MSVEARSLADITSIAAAPPHRPTRSKHLPPLVLYIARVPGSNDVFLTTLKPRRHVVNAEDIRASLYYLHVHDRGDEILQKEQLRAEAGSSSSPSRKPIAPSSPQSQHIVGRKPLPTPPSSPDLLSESTCDGPKSPSASSSIRRKPVSSREDRVPTTADKEHTWDQFDISNGKSSTMLTLIRREPGTGNQWNVADLFLPSSTQAADAASIDIHITNPGYRSFPADRRRHDDGGGAGTNCCTESDAFFRRQLDTQTYLTGDSHRFTHHHGSRGYTFQSPWATKCELSTGKTGRTLECRHHKQSVAGIETSVISELRFDLPALTIRSRNLSRTDGSLAARNDRGHRDSRPDWSLRKPSVRDLDCSLGQEAAGGGLIGRKAKLGKLIVEAEGLQMLDLTVAVNMALWWKAYARTAR